MARSAYGLGFCPTTSEVAGISISDKRRHSPRRSPSHTDSGHTKHESGGRPDSRLQAYANLIYVDRTRRDGNVDTMETVGVGSAKLMCFHCSRTAHLRLSPWRVCCLFPMWSYPRGTPRLKLVCMKEAIDPLSSCVMGLTNY